MLTVINRSIPRRRGVHDLSFRLRRQFSFPERVLKEMEDSMFSGVKHLGEAIDDFWSGVLKLR